MLTSPFKAGDVNFARVEGGGQGMVEFADRDGLQFALDNRDQLTLNGQKLHIRQEERRSGGFRGGDDGFGGRMERGFGDDALGQTLVDREWGEGELEEYSSDVYTPSAATRERPEEEVRQFRALNEIAPTEPLAKCFMAANARLARASTVAEPLARWCPRPVTPAAE